MPARAAAQAPAPAYWTYRAAAAIKALTTGDLDADGQIEILLGTGDGQVLCLASDGNLLWRADLGPAPVLSLATVDRGGSRHVVAGTELGLVELDRAGRKLASRAMGHPVTLLTTADLDGHGREEVLAHWTAGALYRLAPGGDAATTYAGERCRAGQDIAAVCAPNRQGDRRPEILVAATTLGYGSIATHHALTAFAPAGPALWEYPLGSRPVAMVPLMPTSSGRRQVAVATRQGAVCLVDLDGSPIWTVDLQQPCVDLAGGRPGPQRQPGLVVGLDQAIVLLATDGSVRWRREMGAVAKVLVANLRGEGSEQVVAVTVPSAADERSPAARLTMLDGEGRPIAEHRLGGVPSLIEAVDVNADSRQEILVVLEREVQLLADPGGLWRRPQWQAALEGPVRVVLAHPLGLAVGGDYRSLMLIAPDGSTRWQAPMSGEITGLDLADLGGDGQPEIISCYQNLNARGDRTGSGASVHQGDGRPAWQLPVDVLVRSVAAGDLDGNGRNEVVIGSNDNLVRAVNGDGQSRWIRSVGGGVLALRVVDLNGDRAGEVVVGADDGRLAVLAATGAPLWQADLGGRVRYVQTAELDGDGRPELVAGTDGGAVVALHGDGRVLWRYDGGAPVRALMAGDLHGDGRCEAVVALGPRLAVVGANGALFWASDLGGEVVAIASGDTDDDGLNELLAGTEQGDLVVLSPGGELRERQRFSSSITALATVSLHKGRTEIVVATLEGDLFLLQARPDSPPLVANVHVNEASGSYVYAASVVDPEDDPVDLTLEVYDPLRRLWLTDQHRRVLGQGMQHWIRPPFAFWGVGRLAQYRLRAESNGYQFTVGPLPGPRVAGPPPTVLGALLGVVLGVVALRWRREQSPPRRAMRLLAPLRARPAETLATVRGFLEATPRARDGLMALAERARQAGNGALAALAEGLYLLPTQPESGLAILRTAVAANPGWEGAEAQLAILEALEALLLANSLGRLTLLKGPLDRVEAALLQAPAPLRHWAKPVRALNRARSVLRDGERSEYAEDRLLYLEEARHILEAAAAKVEGLPPVPEGPVLAAIIKSWLAVVANAVQEVRGRAVLDLVLKTRRIVGGEEAVVAVTVQNLGRSPASQISVELAPDPAYVTIDGRALIAFLPPGHSRDVEFTIRPQVHDRFRVEFVARYDDPEGRGKTHALGDLVDVLQPSAEFIRIPNPYTPGRPLKPDSPVFFGRDDIFAFIAENARGLCQHNILMLIGQRRTGKTSILLQLSRRLGEDYLPVYLDCQSLGIAPGMAAFFHDVATTIADSVAGRGLNASLPPEEAWREHPTRTFEREFLPPLLGGLGGRTLLLVLDEFEELEDRVAAGRLDAAIFPYLRHLLQHSEDIAFIFVGTHRLEEMTADYWSVLFNTALYRHVGYLDPEAAIRLIAEPVRPYNLLYDDLALNKILRMTAGHPYFLQLICYALVNMHNRTRRNYVTIHEANQAIDEILTLGQAHFAFLWEESSPQERVILVALTRLLAGAGPAAGGDVTNLLAERGLPLDPREVSSALRNLVAREILRQLPGDAPRYEFRVGLVGLWIDRCKSLSQVIEETT